MYTDQLYVSYISFRKLGCPRETTHLPLVYISFIPVMMYKFRFVSLFNRILTFVGYLMPKPSLQKSSSDIIEPIDGGDKGRHIFPEDISSKVKAIEALEFELVYFESTVQLFSHYVTGTSFRSESLNRQ